MIANCVIWNWKMWYLTTGAEVWDAAALLEWHFLRFVLGGYWKSGHGTSLEGMNSLWDVFLATPLLGWQKAISGSSSFQEVHQQKHSLLSGLSDVASMIYHFAFMFSSLVSADRCVQTSLINFLMKSYSSLFLGINWNNGVLKELVQKDVWLLSRFGSFNVLLC